MELKSKHLWGVTDFWEAADSEEENSQRWVIRIMVADLRMLEAEGIRLRDELIEKQKYILKLERATLRNKAK